MTTFSETLEQAHTLLRSNRLVISDLDYLYSVPETDAINLNGGEAIATSTGLGVASGSATETKIDSTALVINKKNLLLAYSSTRATSKASGGSTFSASSASSSASVSR